MTLPQSRLTGLLRLRHAQEVTEAIGEDMDREALRFEALRESGPTRAVSAFNLFQTPEAIAHLMVRRLGSLEGLRVLEPSAGLGRLYRAIRCVSDCEVVMVEQAQQCAAELYRETRGDNQATLIQADFMECDSDRLGGLFDRILMNPPFKQGMDIRHIWQSVSLLKPDGVIVALCYAGVRQKREFERRSGWEWVDLPVGSFRSEGTNAAVAMLVHRKPFTES